jgi:hypothetical protein
MKKIILLFSCLGLILTISKAQNAVNPKNIRTDATFEHISILYEIDGDDNLNSTFSVTYRESGTSNAFIPAAPSMRAHPGIPVDGRNIKYNYHACSAMFLKPGTEYELKIKLEDPNGGGTSRTITVQTKRYPVETDNYKYVSPGNGGGNGTKSNPYLGLQAAANNAQPGVTFIVADGEYSPFSMKKSGEPGNPITFRSENQHGAVINGRNDYAIILHLGGKNICRYVTIDGFQIRNSKWAINARYNQYLTVKNNKIYDVDYGIVALKDDDQLESDFYITNNSFVGRTNWPRKDGRHGSEKAIQLRGNNHVISFNYVSNFNDFISTDSAPQGYSYGLDIHNNDITKMVDDGIEVDGTLSNTRIYLNRVFNVRAGISASPVVGGPCYIFRNLIYNLESTALKFARSPAGIVAFNNTSVSRSSQVFNDKEPFNNFIVKNNLNIGKSLVYNFIKLGNHSSVEEWDYNAAWVNRPEYGYFMARFGSTEYYFSPTQVYNATGFEEHSIVISRSEDLVNVILPGNEYREEFPEDFNFRPTANSDLINAGEYISNIDAPFVGDGQTDIGAFEYGMPLPTYGCVFDNIPPHLAKIGNKSVTEGNSLDVSLSSTDPDGGQLLYSVSPNHDFISLVDNQDGTGVIKISPKLGDAGKYTVTVTVNDSRNGIDSETITITVIGAEQGNVAPVLSPVGNKRVSEGNTLDVSLSANDADGDPMTFSISPNLGFVSLTDNNDGTGVLTFSPVAGNAGSYSFIIRVTDSNGSSDTETFSLIVDKEENENTLPSIDPIGDQFVDEGKALTVNLFASDADGDQLSYSIQPELDFITIRDEQDGVGVLVISPKKGDEGRYNMRVTVSDNNNGTDSETFTLIITNPEQNVANIINSGGSAMAIGSMFLQEDKYFNGGKSRDFGSNEIEDSEHDELYQSIRYGNFYYDIPVAQPGLYTVRLYFAEVGLKNGAWGERVFNVIVENEQQKLINYDINADVGPLKATIKTFTGIEVSDGKLTVDIQSVVRNAIIAGIEVISETENVTGIIYEELQERLTIYPNPSDGVFKIKLSDDFRFENIPYAIYDIAGKIVQHSSMTTGSSTALIDMTGKKKGMYILKMGDLKTEKIFLK